MRILVIGQSDNPGGVETVIKRYYETVKDDVQFDLMVFTDICYDEEYYSLGIMMRRPMRNVILIPDLLLMPIYAAL